MPWLCLPAVSRVTAGADTRTATHTSSTLTRSHHAQRTSSSSPEVGSATSRRSATERRHYYLKMFTARAATSRMQTAEIADPASIMSFARRVSGIASVGLNAIEFVNET